MKAKFYFDKEYTLRFATVEIFKIMDIIQGDPIDFFSVQSANARIWDHPKKLHTEKYLFKRGVSTEVWRRANFFCIEIPRKLKKVHNA